MLIRKNYIDSGNCKGCKNCTFYPYFHFIPVNSIDLQTGKIHDIEYIKFSNTESKVINHTTQTTHFYNGKKWAIQ